jgi:hypothetical protein
MTPPSHRPTKFLPGAPTELWCKRNFRKRDRTGDEIGMFVVTGYVGNNWRTSEYARFRCKKCGVTGTWMAKRLDALKRRTCACLRHEQA